MYLNKNLLQLKLFNQVRLAIAALQALLSHWSCVWAWLDSSQSQRLKASPRSERLRRSSSWLQGQRIKSGGARLLDGRLDAAVAHAVVVRRR